MGSKKAPTKEKILMAAYGLIAEKSYAKVSIDEVAKAAGVSKGAIFHYFDSKYKLAKMALFFAFDETYMKELASFDASNPLQSAKRLIDFSVDASLKNWNLIRYALDLYQAAVEEGENTEDWSSTFSQYVLPVARALAECGVPNPEVKAAMLITFLDALGMEQALTGGSAIDPGQLKEEIFELFVGNYQNRAARRRK